MSQLRHDHVPTPSATVAPAQLATKCKSRVTKDVVENKYADAEFVDNETDPDVEGGSQDTLIGIQSYENFSGPLPHPALFGQYNEILPGAAERIFRMTEKQLDHAIELENAEASANRRLLDAEIAARRVLNGLRSCSCWYFLG